MYDPLVEWGERRHRDTAGTSAAKEEVGYFCLIGKSILVEIGELSLILRKYLRKLAILGVKNYPISNIFCIKSILNKHRLNIFLAYISRDTTFFVE